MLRIRLRRVGKKKQPQYRLVVADSRAPRDGAFIETIGTYNPLTQPETVTLDEARAREWIGKGAVPSDRVQRILAGKGIGEMPAFTPKAKKAVAEPEKPAATAAAAAPAAAEPETAAAEAEASAEA